MPDLITRLGLDSRLRRENIKRYALQCSLAAAVVLILLMVLDAVTQTVLIAALGASVFIAFAVPRSLHSSPRCLIGGYLAGILAGSLMATLNIAFEFSDVVTAHASMVVFGALATGLAMFLMVVTKTEHPTCRCPSPRPGVERVDLTHARGRHSRCNRAEHLQAAGPADTHGLIVRT